jgi:hypothetical protein
MRKLFANNLQTDDKNNSIEGHYKGIKRGTLLFWEQKIVLLQIVCTYQKGVRPASGVFGK